jgi:hypothetical protein
MTLSERSLGRAQPQSKNLRSPLPTLLRADQQRGILTAQEHVYASLHPCAHAIRNPESRERSGRIIGSRPRQSAAYAPQDWAASESLQPTQPSPIPKNRRDRPPETAPIVTLAPRTRNFILSSLSRSGWQFVRNDDARSPPVRQNLPNDPFRGLKRARRVRLF